MFLQHRKTNLTLTLGMLLVGVFATGGFSPHFLSSLSLPHVAAAPSGSFLGIDCAYGGSAPGQVFPTPVITKDGDGLLHSKCQWAGDVDGDGALDPLVSDNPSLGTAGSGGGFIADIILNNTSTRITGFDITIDYDTRVLNAVIVDQSGLLFGGNSGCIVPNCTLTTALTIDRTVGEVRVAQALLGTQAGPGSNCDNGVNPKCNSATQEFFRIRFDVVGSGTGFISFSSDPIKNAIISPDLSPNSVPHTSLNGALSTNDLYNVINSMPMGLGLNVSWTFSPSQEIPGSPLTFTAAAACSNCTGAFTYHWDLSSLDSPTYVPKIDGSGATLTLTIPPPIAFRVTLNVSDSATPAHNWALAVRVLPLTSGTSGLPSVTQLNQGTAGGSWNAIWLGGIVTSSSGYSGLWTFCPGSPSVTTVCNKPKTVLAQSPVPGPITQTSSISGLVFNFAGVYNASFQISDTAVSQIGPAPASVTKYFLVNVTGSTPAYTVILSPSQQVQTQGQPSSFSLTPSYGSTYPSGFRATSFSYLVTFGDGASQTVQGGLSPTLMTHTYTSAGTFQVKVVAHEVGSIAPSKIMESATSTVNVVQTPLTGDFTYNPSSPTPSQSITFTATATGGSSPFTYRWSFGDGSANGTGVTLTHSYSGTGTFNVTLTITDAFGTSFVVLHTISVGSQGVSPLIIGGGVAAALVVAAGLLLFFRRRRSAPSSKA
ncbi:PKD domain-containing protein [Candidatus Bathyarchaeota archaeon]|nr:MAG: PKD domain-containing protein [Candidatus Bathyarchaeota archaeon]